MVYAVFMAFASVFLKSGTKPMEEGIQSEDRVYNMLSDGDSFYIE